MERVAQHDAVCQKWELADRQPTKPNVEGDGDGGERTWELWVSAPPSPPAGCVDAMALMRVSKGKGPRTASLLCDDDSYIQIEGDSDDGECPGLKVDGRHPLFLLSAEVLMARPTRMITVNTIQCLLFGHLRGVSCTAENFGHTTST